MHYREHPIPALAQYVECVWFVTADADITQFSPERILPDGCVEWIFHLGASFERLLPNGREQQPRSFLVGELTRFLLVQPSGRPSVMGIRFRPSGAYRMISMPLAELTNQIVSTADVWGRDGKTIEDAVFTASTDLDRIRIVETFLLGRLFQSRQRPQFETAIQSILRSHGQIRVDHLAHHVELSSRQLEREFQTGIGLSPKSFSRIIRFQNLLRLVGEGTLREWANIALAVGYSDQPHMVREFREFTGRSPTESEVNAVGNLAKHFISPQRLARMLGEKN